MATLAVVLDQTDNGKTLKITDTTFCQIFIELLVIPNYPYLSIYNRKYLAESNHIPNSTAFAKKIRI